MRRRVLVIGLDGATFNVIDSLIKQGEMPNIARLIENGASGPLQSTIPPVTGPAWLALATGVSPETTGVYDFLYRRENGYGLRALSSADYAGRSVWDYLSKAGKHVGVLNYPMLSPPYKINGFMTAGLGASPYEDFTFPKELKRELNKALGNQYEIGVSYNITRYDDVSLFLRDLYSLFDMHVRASEYLLRKKEWDLFWVVFSETDWLQHRMWHCIDERHPLYEGKSSEKFKQGFTKFWSKVDAAIGQFCSIVGDGTHIIVLSDHGFGSNDQVFKLNAWLEQEGYLVRKGGPTRVLNLTRGAIRLSLKRITRRSELDKRAPAFFRWGRRTMDDLTVRVNVLNQIDLEKSIAFDPGHTIPFGGIYVNDRLVDAPQTKQKVADEIAGKLKDWGDKHNLKVEVWRPTSVGNGPDLLVGINEWRCVMLKDQFDGELFEQRPYSHRHTGSHRVNGIFIAAGPSIQKVKVDKAQVYDVAPTLLYLFDELILADMDGRVLREIFAPKHLKEHPINVRDGKERASGESVRSLTEEEEEAIHKRLRDLGYL